MKLALKILPVLFLCFLLTSCESLDKKIEENLNLINEKAMKLDSIVNQELDKVQVLDSIINEESEKIKVLDSLINKSSSSVDSLINGKIDRINKILN